MLTIHRFAFVTLLLVLTLSACGGGSSSDVEDASNNVTPDTTTPDTTTPDTTSLDAASVEVRGRLLASQCFQCHGTNGKSVNGWDSIAGESYNEIMEELEEYPVTHIMGA